MATIETLYPVKGEARDFDALVGTGKMAGRIAIEQFGDQTNTVVYFDRNAPLDESYATRPGGASCELEDDDMVQATIIKAIS